MHKIHFLNTLFQVLFLGAAFSSAAHADSSLGIFAELQALPAKSSEMERPDLRSFGDSCPNTTKTENKCLLPNYKLCKLTNPIMGEKYTSTQGTCPPNSTDVTSDANEFCSAAEAAIGEPPACFTGCKSTGTGITDVNPYTGASGPCCTLTRTRVCEKR